MKTTLLFSIFFAVLCIEGCSLFNQEFSAFTYSNLKKLPNGNRYEATGYFSNDPVPMVVDDPKWLTINMPMPPNAYLLLSGNALDTIVVGRDSTRFYGALVTIKGTIDKSLGLGKKAGMKIETVEMNSPSTSDRGPYIIDHCNLPAPEDCASSPTPPPLCHISDASPHKFALLFSGGMDLPNAKFRYWNDLEFLYLTLRSQYNFSDNNMVVVYRDGQPENSSSPMIVDFRASRLGLDSGISYLTNHMHDHSQTPGIQDTLLIFVTNHGGGYDPSGLGGMMSGSTDSNGDEPEIYPPNPKVDEVIFYFQPSNDSSSDILIKDDVWKVKWNNLITSRNPLMIALYEQCFSGGFIKDMQGLNRVNITAASENAYSYSMPPDNSYDAFSYFFTAALYGRQADGSCLKTPPDYNGNQKVSLWEAYRFAHDNDLPFSTHNHFLDDMGTGIGMEGVVVPVPSTGQQGSACKTLYIK